MKKYNLEKKYIVLVLILLVIVSSIPCFFNEITFGHDLGYHLARIEDLKLACSLGYFPSRLNFNQAYGFGYISSTMYPEIFLYIPVLFRFIGMSLFDSYRLFLIIINIFTVLLGYWSFYKLTNNKVIALISIAIYMLVPYRFTDMYIRAALGEVLGLIFLPLLLLGIKELFYDKKPKIATIVIAGTGIFQSHIVTTEMCVIFCLLICFMNINRFKDLFFVRKLILGIFLCVLINVWFIYPLLDSFTIGLKLSSDYNFASMAIDFKELFNPWKVNFMFLSNGLILNILTLFSMIMLILKHNLEKKGKFYFDLFVLGLLFTFISTDLFPWKNIQALNSNNILNILASNIQFPWRFSVFSIVCLCLSCTYFIWKYAKNFKLIYLVVLLTMFINGVFINYDLVSNGKIDASLNDIVLNAQFSDEFLFKEVDYWQLKYGDFNKGYNTSDGCKVISDSRMPDKLVVNYNCISDDEKYIELPLFFYKGWQITDNEIKADLRIGQDHRIKVVLNSNSGMIVAKYKKIKRYMLTDVISLLTLIIFVYFVIVRKKEI